MENLSAGTESFQYPDVNEVRRDKKDDSIY